MVNIPSIPTWVVIPVIIVIIVVVAWDNQYKYKHPEEYREQEDLDELVEMAKKDRE